MENSIGYSGVNKMNEPEITINGIQLNSAEAITIRVAVSSFLSNLKDENALGDDEHGKRMRKEYLKNLGIICLLMEKNLDE